MADLAWSEHFYAGALGFEVQERGYADAALASLYGAHRISQVILRRFSQALCLQAFEPAGAAYPAGAAACDQVFQHFAMPVADIGAAYARLGPFGATLISTAGPQQLPERSGGATAYKFRDPDLHPLELIQLPNGSNCGIDHSAIAVTDVERSIAFYRGQLGFGVASRQVNTGVEQDHLDGLTNTSVDVVALAPQQPTPHVELLGYRTPLGRPAPSQQPHDIAATRLVLEVDALPDPAVVLSDGTRAALLRDPDGHLLLLMSQA